MPVRIMSIVARLAVAVAVGFLGASPFTMASGLIPGLGLDFHSVGPLTTVSGVILFILTLALLGPVTRLVQKTLEALGRVEERPGPAVTLGMLGMGTLCAIAAMVVQYNALGAQSSGLTMHVGNMPSQVVVQSAGSFGLGVLSILTFLLGAAMIALGIWASLKPSSTPPIPHAIKPKVPEFDEAAV
jgi:hypothetical protein